MPDRHQDVDFVFTETFNNSGFKDGATSGGFFWLYVLPVGFLLTMYTVTGYDASAHVSEETHEAEMAAAKGIWQSVFFSAVIGWFVLLAITFAATDIPAINDAGGYSPAIFTSAMSEGWAETVILISFLGQVFCGMACVTSCSRTFFAFSRDRAVPGWRFWSSVNAKHVPVAAVLGSCVLALIITIPALWGTRPASRSRSSRSSRSRSSASTSRTSRRSTCAGGPARTSRRVRGRSARSTAG